MSKVYVVLNDDHEDICVNAVFASKEKAVEYVKATYKVITYYDGTSRAYTSHSIESWEVW